MSTVLVVTVDLGGNVPPVLGVAAELARRGHRVVLHADEAVRSRAADAGCELLVAEGAEYDPLLARGTVRTLRDITRLFADRARGHSVVAAARTLGADVVLVDALLTGTAAEVEAAGLPTVLLGHTTWEYLRRSWGGGPVTAALRLRGAAPMPVLDRADRLLLLTGGGLDPAAPLPGNALRVGAVLQEPAPAAAPTTPPTVLVSLSSIWYPGMQETLQRVLDGLGPLAIRVEVTTGRTIRPAAMRAPANAVLHEYADHAPLLARASAVVGHGGHATTVRALAHGVPVLVLPMHPMLDQPMIGRAVAASGAGLTLPKTAAPAAIGAAVERLLAEPSFAATAREIAADLQAQDGAAPAADEVERIAARAHPVVQ
ncbi:MAG TPA: nucleotide disphospho-sugar-binding domain-containing protein [Amnibacterium sp.]|jgi:UDP:flavonoid glycosyltransferase YjiC (YdhE family)|uniref:glycosyltransferase n=1 Tax=Amnibacterium sp. TaxID=1872496 RepID=UPI002F937D28